MNAKLNLSRLSALPLLISFAAFGGLLLSAQVAAPAAAVVLASSGDQTAGSFQRTGTGNRQFTQIGSPGIHGNPRVGQTVEVTGRIGAFSPEPTTWRYQWLRNGNPIPNATSRTYTIRNADAGQQIAVRVTARREGFANRTVTLPHVQVEVGPIVFGRSVALTSNEWVSSTATFSRPFDGTAILRQDGRGRFFEPMPGNAFWIVEADMFNNSTHTLRFNTDSLGFRGNRGQFFNGRCPETFRLHYFGSTQWQQIDLPARATSRVFICVEAPSNVRTTGQFGLLGWNGQFTRMFRAL